MEKYLFPTGAIREAEKKLIDPNDLERMVDAPNAGQSFKIFNELSYADELLDVDSPERYAEVLAHDLGQVKDFLCLITPDEDTVEIVLAEYNFLNLKILFKAKLAGLEDIEHISPLGSIPKEKLKDVVLKQGLSATIPGEYGFIVNSALKELAQVTEPRTIDSYFDRKYFNYILNLATELNDGFLVDIIKAKIDTANIKTVIRSKLLARPQRDVAEDIITGGNINDYNILSGYDKDLAPLVGDLTNALADARATEEINKFFDSNEPWCLEKALDNYLVRIIKEAKTRDAGPRVMAAYFFAKKNAIKNIRLIMAGKLNNIPASEIKERVRELY